jgi:membrane protease YdiL (CAAX protease family)
MDSDLRCTKCGEMFPSSFWFKVAGVCSNCYSLLSDEEKVALGAPIHQASSAEQGSSFPTVGSAFVVSLLAWILGTLVMLLLIPFRPMVPQQVLVFVSYTIANGCLLLVFASVVRGGTRSPGTQFDFRLPPLRTLLLSVAGILFTFVAFLSAMLMYRYLSPAVSSMSTDYSFLLNPFHIVTALLLAPALEELLYRGVLLNRLLQKYSPPTAIVVSSLVFGLAHEPARMFVAVVLGSVIGWVYWRTASLIITMSMHAVCNFVPIVIAFVAKDQAVAAGASVHPWVSTSWLYSAIAVSALLVLMLGRAIAQAQPLPQWRSERSPQS